MHTYNIQNTKLSIFSTQKLMILRDSFFYLGFILDLLFIGPRFRGQNVFDYGEYFIVQKNCRLKCAFWIYAKGYINDFVPCCSTQRCFSGYSANLNFEFCTMLKIMYSMNSGLHYLLYDDIIFVWNIQLFFPLRAEVNGENSLQHSNNLRIQNI